MDFAQARTLFPGLNNKVFLDAACVSLIPITAKQEMVKFLDMALECPARDASFHHIAMDVWRQKTCEDVAQLFRVEQDQIALVESTTHGLNIATNCIPFEKGDEVLIVDTEFLQVAIPFSKQQERDQIKIVPVTAPAKEFVTMDHIKAAVNDKTKALCISSVQWCNGYRFPMKELGEFCREKDIWLIVDAVHEAGVLNIDLSKRYCDFFITGGHKWLNAPYGCGIMVLSDKALALEPQSYGYLALEEPSGGWGSFFQDPTQTPYREYKYPKSAKKFEIAGTSNYPGAIGLAESIKIVNALGIEQVEQYVLKLAGLLRGELEKMGATLVSCEDPATWSSITVFQIFDNPEQDRALLEKLLDEKIFVSIRFTSGKGGIRVSTHYFNNEEDVLKLCKTIRNLR